jgi:DGQHR domain-containing protein
MKRKLLSIRALRSHQGSNASIYSFFVPGEVITQIADICRIDRDDKFELQGFQRKGIKHHIDQIVEYLDHGDVLFPNAIILALSEDVTFTQARGKAPKGVMTTAQIGTLKIPVREEGQRVAWIVDGQQRSLALSASKNGSLPVPVIAFVAPDLETQREQFILVNKAKPLPTRLINELLPEVDTHLPHDLALRKVPSEVCNLLHRDPASPFAGLIKRASEPGNRKAVVIDTALIEAIKLSISSPLGALSQFKSFGSEPADTAGMYSALKLYWGQVREVFPDAWGKPPAKSRLMHGAGIKSMGVLMDRIMPRAISSDNPKAELRRSLEAMKPHCCWTEGTWEDLGLRWNEIQNVSRHVRALTEQLIKIDYDFSQRGRK